RSVADLCASSKRSLLKRSELPKARLPSLIPHNDRPNQALTACAPGMFPHTCVFALGRIIFSSSEARMRPKIMPVVRTSTPHFLPNSTFPPTIERLLTIEHP